jgi:hypothetical protein
VLLDFSQALKAQGLEVSSRISTFDAVGAVGGFSGQFVVASIAAFACGVPRAVCGVSADAEGTVSLRDSSLPWLPQLTQIESLHRLIPVA